MREVASDVRGVVIEPCGHFLAEERPDELATALLAFFGEEG
jgi:pimeloyl-ACP methyl ester carboxylesterase